MDIADVKTVADLESFPEAVFVSDYSEVLEVLDLAGVKDTDYDSLFVITGDGEYLAIWGMYGIVPYNEKPVFNLLLLPRFSKSLAVGDLVFHQANPSRIGHIVENTKNIRTEGVLDLAVEWHDDHTVQYFYTDQYLTKAY